MNPTAYDLYKIIEKKGYVPPVSGQIILDSMTKSAVDPSSGANAKAKFIGTGEHLKDVMELDRVNVFKCYFGTDPQTESTWLAGSEPGHGMLLARWAERLIHADVMVMQETVDTTIDYLLHCMAKDVLK